MSVRCSISWRGYVRNRLSPAVDRLELRLGQTLVERLLHGERGVQVLTHDGVFELGGQAQHIDQSFTMLDDERRLGRGPRTACGQQVRKYTLSAGLESQLLRHTTHSKQSRGAWDHPNGRERQHNTSVSRALTRATRSRPSCRMQKTLTSLPQRTLTVPERYQPSDLPHGVDPGAFIIADRFVRGVIVGEPMSLLRVAILFAGVGLILVAARP